MSTTLFTLLTMNAMSILVAFTCIVCLVLLLQSAAIPANAVRVGAAGFACLLLEALFGIGTQSWLYLLRETPESYRTYAPALAAGGFARLALHVAGLLLLVRALFVGYAKDRPLVTQ